MALDLFLPPSLPPVPEPPLAQHLCGRPCLSSRLGARLPGRAAILVAPPGMRQAWATGRTRSVSSGERRRKPARARARGQIVAPSLPDQPPPLPVPHLHAVARGVQADTVGSKPLLRPERESPIPPCPCRSARHRRDRSLYELLCDLVHHGRGNRPLSRFAHAANCLAAGAPRRVRAALTAPVASAIVIRGTTADVPVGGPGATGPRGCPASHPCVETCLAGPAPTIAQRGSPPGVEAGDARSDPTRRRGALGGAGDRQHRPRRSCHAGGH